MQDVLDKIMESDTEQRRPNQKKGCRVTQDEAEHIRQKERT